MRIFIAIPLPDDLKQSLAELQTSIDGIRWQQPTQMHLTLKFLGEISQQKLDALLKALDSIEQKKFKLMVEGWGTFPKEGVPKVIWAGISQEQELTKLQKKIEGKCLSLDFDALDQPFIPHVTMGRVRKNISRKKLGKILDASTWFEFFVNAFNVYQSELSPEGAVHTVIKKYPLSEKRTDNG